MIDQKLSSALKVGLVLQVALLLLCGLVLDDGSMARLCAAAIAGYWIAFAIIVARRNKSPSKLDLFFVKYGAAGLLFATPFLAKLVYLVIGESCHSGLERLFGRG